MPQRTRDWLERIKAVEREHAAARLAADRLLADVQQDAGVLGSGLRPRDVREMSIRLDGTFVVRLFAEFETGLRLFWSALKKTDPPNRTRDLLDGVAANRRIPDPERAAAHEVREYRNSLVHERDEPTDPIPIPDARGALCTFFAYLPREW